MRLRWSAPGPITNPLISMGRNYILFFNVYEIMWRKMDHEVSRLTIGTVSVEDVSS